MRETCWAFLVRAPLVCLPRLAALSFVFYNSLFFVSTGADFDFQFTFIVVGYSVDATNWFEVFGTDEVFAVFDAQAFRPSFGSNTYIKTQKYLEIVPFEK